MRVWIVNYYTCPNCSNPRYEQLAKHFMAKGWDVITFYANNLDEKKSPLFVRKKIGDFDYVHVKSPAYSGNGFGRMKSIFYFAWRIFRHAKDFERPDVVLHNIHTPFDYPVLWAARKVKAKYIAEAWDLWPDEFANYGLVSRKHPAMKFFYWVEKKLYYNADQLVFTFLGGIDYIQRKGWTRETGGKIDIKRVHYINNGVDIKQFDMNKTNYIRKDDDINRKDIIKIMYVGSINLVNHVQTLVEAAELFKEDHKYVFFIYGDGAYRDQLERYVSDHHLSNVVFKERHIPFNEVAWVVSQSTVNIMNYEKGFGDIGVSSGKFFLYLAAGKPIICNVRVLFDDVITDNNLGVAKDINTAEEFASSIKYLAELPEEDYKAMCIRVREAAMHFDYNVIAADEIKVVEAAMNNS